MAKMNLSALTPDPGNPRTITKTKLAMLRESMTYYGDLSGVIQVEGGDLVGGHQRVEAFRGDPQASVTITQTFDPALPNGTVAEGYIEAAGSRFAYRVCRWDSQKARGAMLASNKGAGSWDMPLVAEMMGELDASGFDMDLTLFDQQERDNLLEEGAPFADAPEENDDADETESDLRKTNIKHGDILKLGRHWVICGDCSMEAIKASVKAAGDIGLVLTDPPYGISVVKNEMVGAVFAGSMAKKGKYIPVHNDNSVPRIRWLTEMGAKAIIWGGNYFADQLPPSNSWLIWDKRCDSGIENTFADCELAWSNHGGPARIHRQLWNGMIREGEHDKRIHPTQKPVALMRWAILTSKTQGIVFDPFLGSGSTLIACEQQQRSCVGVEYEPQYCQLIVDRWEKETGQQAEIVPADDMAAEEKG